MYVCCLVWKQSETCVLDSRLNAGWINFDPADQRVFFPSILCTRFANFARVLHTEFDGWIWMVDANGVGKTTRISNYSLTGKHGDWFYLHEKGTRGLTLRCGRIIDGVKPKRERESRGSRRVTLQWNAVPTSIQVPLQVCTRKTNRSHTRCADTVTSALPCHLLISRCCRISAVLRRKLFRKSASISLE